MSHYEPIRNPRTGETYKFLEAAGPDSDLVMEWRLAPGGGVPEHVHPRQEEIFELTAGQVVFRLDGERRIAGKGERVRVPAGVAHDFRNEGDTEASARLIIRPAMKMREFFETTSGLARDGKTDRRGRPRNPLQLAVFAEHFAEEFHATSPPRAVQRLVVPPLGALGRRLGYRAVYPQYAAARAEDSVTAS